MQEPSIAEVQTSALCVLSPDCEAFLASQELFSQAHERDPELADIYDVDGDRITSVTRTIGVRDLCTLYFHGRTQYDRGVARGREACKAALRNLIGAAAAAADGSAA